MRRGASPNRKRYAISATSHAGLNAGDASLLSKRETRPMNESPDTSSFLDLNQVFSRLTPQDVEQFQLLYQHWTLQQQIAAIERQIADVQRQLAENAEHIDRKS